jgi:hypothetical protein
MMPRLCAREPSGGGCRGLGPGIEPNFSASLREARCAPERALPLIDAEAAQYALDAATDAAWTVGNFGAPTFAVGTEICWGDDRLEDALAWRRGGLRPLGMKMSRMRLIAAPGSKAA